jgi:hypothetical protein
VNNDPNLERLAQLAPVRDNELLDQTWTPEARQMLSEIVAISVQPPTHPRRIPRRRWLAAPTLAAAIVLAAFVFIASTGGGGTETAAAAVLKKAASVARSQPALTLAPGQYLYTKSVDAYTSTAFSGETDTTYTVLVPHVRQVWLGPDGGRLHETSGPATFLTEADRAHWVTAGRPDLTSPPSDTPLDAPPKLDLPTDPDALYTRLEHEASATDNPLAAEMFTLVGDSLRETAASPDQRAALYQVAARLPGVELVGSVTDSAGRSGIGVALSNHGIRSMLIFDPGTSALLAEEYVALPGNSYGYAAGTRTGYSTYLEQAVVDSQTATS